jgi:5-deoxy-glucuronate isomerase
MSTTYLVPPGKGHHTVFRHGEAEIQWLGLEVLRLDAGETWEDSLGDEEAALVLLSGKALIEVKASALLKTGEIGDRGDIFEATGHAVYAPRRSNVSIVAVSEFEMGIAKSPCELDLEPQLISPHDVKVVDAGALNWARDVRLIIPPGSPISQRLIVGETLNPPGNWSGVPPHKHDRVTENENLLEEFYFFKSDPPDGYGIQPMYADGQGQGYLVGENTVTVMLQGYHPTVAAPGTTLCYLWVLAGEKKDYKIQIDPRFRWVADAEAKHKQSAG